MAGTIIESELTTRSVRPSSAIRFALATKADDTAIRRLLRENPMRGAISVSIEREPDYFHGTQIAGAEDQTILAFAHGRLVCMGRCSVRERYINGRIHRVGYLSELRLDHTVAGRFDILRRGYQFFHELNRDHQVDFYFTSITADNARSVRFLERGLPGMPKYEQLTDFVTLLIPIPRKPGRLKRLNARAMSRLKPDNIEVVTSSERHIYALTEALNSQAKHFNLAAVWREEKLSSLKQHGLGLSQFTMFIQAGRVIACAALWDQRPFRQTVIRGYSPGISLIRPLLNFGDKLFGSSRLPPAGSTLAHGFLSPLAVAPNDRESLLAMVELSLVTSANRGLDFLTLGFTAGDPRLAFVQDHFRCREYKNQLFQVRWNNENSERIILNRNPVFPEVALL